MRKPSKNQQIDTRPPVGISYIRFSTLEQRKGDSTRRQKTDAEKWCQVHGVPLDQKLSCKDAGRSALHGKHRSDKAALGQFLECVREGKVPRGSYLVIENLDRLSREDERTALRLWLDILDAGVSIVQLHPETIFRHEKSDMVDIMRAIIELSRGHSESRMKSVRSLANWERLLDRARKGEMMPPRRKDGKVEKVMTKALPGWVTIEDGLPMLIPERAVVVKRIFEMARAGYGGSSIVKKLNAEKVPAFGDRVVVEDEDGNVYWQAAPGERYGCGEWRSTYVRKILCDRRALGEYQPGSGSGRKKGEPIAGYFPAVVTPEEFYAARVAVVARSPSSNANRAGRIGEGVASLFGGLLRHARDGSTYYVAGRLENGERRRVLLNKSSVESDARAYTFNYHVFERCILSCLREIKPAEIAAPVPVTEVSVLQGELNELRERKAALALELLKGDVVEIGEALRGLKAREDELLEQIDEGAEQVAAPRSDAWKTMQTLVDVLDATPPEELEDVRLRLRAALRRIIESVWVLIVPRGKGRFAAAQIRFAEGGRTRSYLIWRKPEIASALCGTKRARVPEEVRALDFADVSAPDDFDLRDKQDVCDLEQFLAGLDLSTLSEAD
jgi:DNA invertase Pin-like site-specific DNA recombinase